MRGSLATLVMKPVDEADVCDVAKWHLEYCEMFTVLHILYCA